MFTVTLADCDIQTFSASGPGGQHRDHSNSAVRVTHRASGAVGTAKDSRSQAQNKKAAFHRMARTDTFTAWVRLRCARMRKSEADLELEVERDMRPANLKMEVKDDEGRWVEDVPHSS